MPGVTADPPDGISADVLRSVEAYAATEPRLDVWRRYPHVSDEEDAFTDTWACGNVSLEFVQFARSHGLNAIVVEGERSRHPWGVDHMWSRIRIADHPIDIDWTVRQMHNLDDPPSPAHIDLPCPLIWKANGDHPVGGGFEIVSELTHIRGPADLVAHNARQR